MISVVATLIELDGPNGNRQLMIRRSWVVFGLTVWESVEPVPN